MWNECSSPPFCSGTWVETTEDCPHCQWHQENVDVSGIGPAMYVWNYTCIMRAVNGVYISNGQTNHDAVYNSWAGRQAQVQSDWYLLHPGAVDVSFQYAYTDQHNRVDLKDYGCAIPYQDYGYAWFRALSLTVTYR